MKFEKFISIGVINALLLLILAAFIASCQKKDIQSKGYFSHYQNQQSGRFPASLPPSTSTQFSHKQDSKQIYIYCYHNSLKVKQCYEHHFNQILSQFLSKFGPLDGEKLVKLKERNSFEHVAQRVNDIQKNIFKELNPKLDSIVKKREKFCGLNSKTHPSRCMNQYLERDSLAILNAYQYENNRMNGPEYIFLKKSIEESLKTKLELSSNRLKTKLNL